ncbi:MAG TPA: hypothetical protein VK191_14425 [Symbiobacteriaceae bacterium]|nr:hypothetical protein [Symbiobacteriaceae bacterium]
MHHCYDDSSGLSGSCSAGMSDRTGYHHGWYMQNPCAMPMPHKEHHYHMPHPMPPHKKPPHGAPWLTNLMRETEIELGGGKEIEKPNPLGNWMGHMGDWFRKEAGADPSMGMDGGSKWGNWLGKGADGTGGMDASGGAGGGKRPMGHRPGTGMTPGMTPGMEMGPGMGTHDMSGGKMGNWMGKGAGATGDRNDDDQHDGDGSGKRLWPK